jgi:hypothetical protein
VASPASKLLPHVREPSGWRTEGPLNRAHRGSGSRALTRPDRNTSTGSVERERKLAPAGVALESHDRNPKSVKMR